MRHAGEARSSRSSCGRSVSEQAEKQAREAVTKQRAQHSRKNSEKAPPPERLIPYCFEPGQSGNPGGRPRRKPLTDILEQLLAQEKPGDKRHRTYAQLLIEAFVTRAIKKSDVLLKETFDRVEGKVGPESKDEAQKEHRPRIVVLDIPRPARPFPLIIPVTPEYYAAKLAKRGDGSE